jgi:hypothetical protein
VSSINFVQIFWSFVKVKKLQDFFSWNNTVKVAVNEQNGHVAVYFFENFKIVNLKDITLDFFDGSLLHKKEKRFDEERG